MANTIQVKRGEYASLPTLAAGEPGFCTDTKQFFIGDGAANQEIVMHKLFDANTILAANSDDTPAAVTVAEDRIVGRKSGGNIAALAKADLLTILNVEDGADVTDADNVDSAGATMNTDTDVSGNSWVLDQDDLSDDDDQKVPTQQSVKAYVDAAVVGLYDHKGGYNASTNTPDLDTSPSGVKKGDAYTVSVAGTFFTEDLEVGDVIIADQDDPTQLSHWTRVNKNIDAATTTSKGVVELATDGESGAGVVVQGNDSRLSDSRDPNAHASDHITGGSDEIDGDKLDIDWNPSNYTPATTPAQADNVDNLTAHLYGIDQALASVGSTTFVGLTDTPANFTDDGLKIVRVNSTPDALEFVDFTSTYLEGDPTEDEADKAPTSEWAFDHDAATTGVHGAGGNTLLHSGSTIDGGAFA